jgi:glycerate kinase
MRVLCCPDKFRGTLTAAEAAEAMALGARDADGSIETDPCPVADGGEGTLDALAHARDLERRSAMVTGPRGAPITAEWAIDRDSGGAVIELAAASGLAHVEPGDRNPTATTTYGTGELIARAVEQGCGAIVLGIGGSATCDGGCGLAQALGATFLDDRGRAITEPITGGHLHLIQKIVPPADLPAIDVICDVMNPLCGPDGAAAVYGPQKGATREQVRALDAGLARLAGLVDVDPDQPMFGASGGAAFGLAALCGATLHEGIEYVLNALDFDSRLAGSDLVLTGEGSLDAQSLHGKACAGVAARARAAGTPVMAIVGRTDDAETGRASAHDLFDGVVSLERLYGRKCALNEAYALVREAATHIVEVRLG